MLQGNGTPWIVQVGFVGVEPSSYSDDTPCTAGVAIAGRSA